MEKLATSVASVELDVAVYRLTAIKKAAYKFGDRCYVQIDTGNDGKVRVVLTPKRTKSNDESLTGDFCNEVLDQELREVVAQETEGVRNLLLAQAFSATTLINPEGDTADYRDDPQGIRQPDDQKSMPDQLDGEDGQAPQT